jgi:carboxyl-terminal processing protease
MGIIRKIRRQLPIGLLVIAVFVTGFALGNQHEVSHAQGGAYTPSAQDEKLFQSFWQTYQLIQSEYIDKVDKSVLVDGATKGMVDALGDEFSGYMDAKTYPLLNDDLSGQIDGIGVVIHTIETTKEIEISNVLKGTPAESAGVKPGDIFEAVNGVDVTGMNQLDLATRVRGPAGTSVEIKFKRGSEFITLKMTRAHITVPNIESKVLDGKIGYVKLYEFTDQARQDLDKALKSINVNQLNGLIFDLRGNPGGLLTSAVDIGSAFIKDGVILYEEFGDGREEVYNATGNYDNIKVPIVVLVDENSASASELIAGALQDRKVATLMGEKTFGKGTVQTWNSLVNGGGVRLTIARWLTPNKHWIHKVGITPDVNVVWNPTDPNDPNDIQLKAAEDFLTTKTKTTVIATVTPAP